MRKAPRCFKASREKFIVLRCNFSEIYSNVLISVTDGGGAMEFRPSISLKDGHLTGAGRCL